jgi:hypothetical protein
MNTGPKVRDRNDTSTWLTIDAGCGRSYVSGSGESVSENAWHQISTVVTLRRLIPADIEAVHTLLSDWTVVRYMLLPHCETLEESQKCLDELIRETLVGLGSRSSGRLRFWIPRPSSACVESQFCTDLSRGRSGIWSGPINGAEE